MRKLFIALIALGAALLVGVGVFMLYLYPARIRPRQKYNEAAELFNKGDYVSSALRFDSMGNYSDSPQRAKMAWLYAGEKSFEEGDLAQARTYFLKAGAGQEEFSKLDSAYYQLGVKAYAEDQRIEAENCFSCISQGSSYLPLLDSVRISSAERFIMNGDFDSAGKVFHLCGKDSYKDISEIWFEYGRRRLDSVDLENASYCFAKAMAFSEEPEALKDDISALWKAAGTAAMGRGEYALAEKCFKRAGDGGGVDDTRSTALYESGVTAYNEGRFVEALNSFYEAGDFLDAEDRAEELRNGLKNYFNSGCGYCWALLSPDGTVAIEGDWGSYVSPVWSDIKSVAVGTGRYMLGVKNDGSVLFHGNGASGCGEVASWQNIIAAACGRGHSVGVRADGTVAACGTNTSGQVGGTASWSGVIAAACGDDFTVGLRSDGTLLSCGSNAYGQCETSAMSGIVMIACGSRHTVALRSDGTVVACGDDSSGQCSVSEWTNIVAVFAGGEHTVGLKADGTLVACGSNDKGQCSVGDVSNVLNVACGASYTLVLLNDGTRIKFGN
ncbi:MAG: hypothetical protein IJM18_10725 [Clostridia bacterium]|nr:hypothetical protein [Clostridia bacterium]